MSPILPLQVRWWWGGRGADKVETGPGTVLTTTVLHNKLQAEEWQNELARQINTILESDLKGL